MSVFPPSAPRSQPGLYLHEEMEKLATADDIAEIAGAAPALAGEGRAVQG